MEPSIYKPSIYKGAGIYKIGAEGGGVSEFGGFKFGDIVYPYDKFGDLYWITQNLCYIDSNLSKIGTIQNDIPGYGTFGGNEGDAYAYGLYYNQKACEYINGILTNGWRVPILDDLNNLKNYVSSNAKKILAKEYGGNKDTTFNLKCYGFKFQSTNYNMNDYAQLFSRTIENVRFQGYNILHNSSTFENGTAQIGQGAILLRLCKDA